MVDWVPEARKWLAKNATNENIDEATMKMVHDMADDIEGWEEAFELYANANTEATRLYREAHPDYEFKLPDQGKMIRWLCDQLKIARAVIDKLGADDAATREVHR